MESLKIENLWFKYPQADEPCLKDVSISIARGEIVLVAGESGSGKTTLLRSIKPSVTPNGFVSGLVSCDFLDDIDSSSGFVFQRPEDQTVREYVWQELAFVLESKGIDSGKTRKKTAETASFFGIEGLFGRKMSELSGGQQQTVALASIMADMPELLILDEPCSMLDPVSAMNFAEELRRICNSFGTTILVSAHNLGDFISLCDKLCIMDRGIVRYYGAPSEVICRMRDEKSPMLRDMPCQCYVSAALGKSEPSLTVSSGRRFLVSYALKNRPNPVESKEAAHGETAVDVRELSFSYDGIKVLKDLNFRAYSGHVCAVFGGNGSGKTTFFKLIAGMEKGYAGSIKKAGNACYIPQDPKIMTRFDRVEEEITSRGGGKKDAELFGLEKLMDKHPYDLSGGELQRLAACIAHLSSADIYLFDEPTKGMDSRGKNSLKKLIFSLRNSGKCIIIASHDLDFCAEAADECCLLFDGNFISREKTADFIMGNMYYTTAAAKMAEGVVYGAVTADGILAAFGTKYDGNEPDPPIKMCPSLKDNKRTETRKKGVGALTILFLLTIPLSVAALCFFNAERIFFLSSLSAAIFSMLAAVTSYERSKPTASDIVVLAVMCAVACAGRIAFFAAAGFKPLLAMVIISGVALGKTAGFMTGMLSMFLSNFVFGQGTWTIFQMTAAGLIGFLSGFLDKNKVIKSVFPICVFGVLSAVIIYGGVVNPSYILAYQNKITIQMVAATYASGLPFDLIHGAATGFFLFLTAKPMIKMINRAKCKYI